MNPNYFNGYLVDTMASSAVPIEVPIKLVGQTTAHSYATTDRVVVTACRLETDSNGEYRVYLDDSADGSGTGDNVIPIITEEAVSSGNADHHVFTLPGEMFFAPESSGSAWKIWCLGPNSAEIHVACSGYLLPHEGFNTPG